MRSWAGGVQIFTRLLLMRRTAFQLVGLGDKNNGRKAHNLLEQRTCSDSTGGSSGSATAIIVQRQCRNTARAEGTNYGHSSAERALCNCTVDFDWQPERSQGFRNRIKDLGFREGLRQHPKQPLTFQRSSARGARRSPDHLGLIVLADFLLLLMSRKHKPEPALTQLRLYTPIAPWRSAADVR